MLLHSEHLCCEIPYCQNFWGQIYWRLRNWGHKQTARVVCVSPGLSGQPCSIARRSNSQSTKSSWLLSTVASVAVSRLCFQLTEKSFAKLAWFKSGLERCWAQGYFWSQTVLCLSCKIHLWQRLSQHGIVDPGYRSCCLGFVFSLSYWFFTTCKALQKTFYGTD